MSSRPFRILLFSAQRGIMRHLSKFLGAVGYEVQQVADSQHALAILDDDPPDFLILDAKPDVPAAVHWCRQAFGQARPGYVYTLLLVENPTADDLLGAVEAGVDDFLARPIVYGELLVRLRAGARVLEFERRIRQQAGVDRLTGLPNRWQFQKRWSADWPAGEDTHRTAACVMTDVDFLASINRAHGRTAGDAVIRAVADKLRESCGDATSLGCFGGGRFCVWLPEKSDLEAAAWAERSRQTLAEMEVEFRDTALRITASFGVAACPHEQPDAEAVIQHAAEALQAAKCSGRNCVVRSGQFDDDAQAWADFAAPGKLFERTVARDVMTPCTLVLGSGDTMGRAAALFRRTGVKALPVVDADGNLAGLVSQQSVLGGPDGEQLAALTVGEVMATEVPRYQENASLAELKDFFTRDSRAQVVIVCDQRPTGLVTPNSLAALGVPLQSDTFAPADPYASSTAYLRVADLSPLESAP